MMILVMIDVAGNGRERLSVQSRSEVSFCSTALLEDSFGQTIRYDGFGHDTGHADVTGIVDANRWWTDEYDLGLVRLYDAGGAPHPLCVRGQLADSIANLKKLDWLPVLGLEIECIALRTGQGASDLPAPRKRELYGPLLDGESIGRYVLAATKVATARGIDIQGAYREIEPGQVEFVTNPGDALSTADDGYLLRRVLADVGRDAGITPSFDPQPRSAGFGNGLHINVSLSSISRRNPWPLAAAQKCAALMTGRLEDACALLVPSSRGYERLRNSEFASCSQFWATGRRDVLVRVVEATASGPRLEIRIADPECNIHLASAAVLELVRYGLSADSTPETNKPTLPGSLPEALQRLRTSTVYGALRESLVEAYIRIKESELRGAALYEIS